MQLAHANRQFDTSVDSPIHEAQIIATPQMFKILYDQLYTKKELAIVRELISNAWDAHVAAGTTDTPISIHLPTLLEPWFEVQDFGTGLSKDDVIGLYMDYGRSNKTHTNSMIGGFGLGSKSPFAYTDQFTVVSRFNGMMYTFQAFLQKSGAPGCMLVDERQSDEPNGLTVRVETNNPSYTNCQFKASVEQLYPHIPTAPTVNLNLGPRQAADFELDVTNHPIIQRIEATRNDGYIHVVQGLVPYIVNWHDIYSYVSRLHPDDRAMMNRLRNITVRVPIGTFEVTASREALSLNDKAKNDLMDLMSDAYKIIRKKLEEQLGASKTWFEWITAAQNLFGGTSDVSLPKHLLNPPLIRQANPQVMDLTNGRDHYVQYARLYYTYRSNRADVRLTPKSTVSYDFNGATVFVRAKNTDPYKQQLLQHFDDEGTKEAILVVGDRQTIEDNLKALGLTCDVRDLPPAIRRKHAAKPRYGATQYDANTIEIHDGKPLDRYHKKTLNELLDELGEDARISMDASLSYFAEVQLKGLGTAPFKTLCNVFIPRSHTRVIERLRTRCDQYIERNDIFNEFVWDLDAVAWARAMHIILRELSGLQLPGNQYLQTALLHGDGHARRLWEAMKELSEIREIANKYAVEPPACIDPADLTGYDWLLDQVRAWIAEARAAFVACIAKHPIIEGYINKTFYDTSWVIKYFEMTKRLEDKVIDTIIKE